MPYRRRRMYPCVLDVTKHFVLYVEILQHTRRMHLEYSTTKAYRFEKSANEIKTKSHVLRAVNLKRGRSYVELRAQTNHTLPH